MNHSINKNYSILLLMPGFVIYLILFILPSIIGACYSFTYWDIFKARFCGLENYINILSDPDLNIAIKNSAFFAVITTFFKVGLGLVLAVFLNQQLKTKNFLRTVYFLPAVLNNVAVALMFTAILHPSRGILNAFLRTIGLGFLAQRWLTDIHVVMYTVSAMEVWKWTGFTMVIILAGLQSISNEYYEAADIDGASSWQKFSNVTFPLIMPAFNNSLVINLIGGLKVFDIIYATTQGGPGSATEVLNSMIFKAYGGGRYGEASAGNMLLSVAVGVVVILAYRILRKKEVEL